MTAFFFQSDLKRELEQVLAQVQLKVPNQKEQYTKIRIFEQALPKVKVTYEEYESEEEVPEEMEELCPYLIIELENGTISLESEIIEVLLIVTIFDDDLSNEGHKDILNIFHVIHERFCKNPNLANKYYRINEIEWALQDGDLYPYFCGAMKLTFKTKTWKREDEFA